VSENQSHVLASFQDATIRAKENRGSSTPGYSL